MPVGEAGRRQDSSCIADAPVGAYLEDRGSGMESRWRDSCGTRKGRRPLLAGEHKKHRVGEAVGRETPRRMGWLWCGQRPGRVDGAEADRERGARSLL